VRVEIFLKKKVALEKWAETMVGSEGTKKEICVKGPLEKVDPREGE